MPPGGWGARLPPKLLATETTARTALGWLMAIVCATMPPMLRLQRQSGR